MLPYRGPEEPMGQLLMRILLIAVVEFAVAVAVGVGVFEMLLLRVVWR